MKRYEITPQRSVKRDMLSSSSPASFETADLMPFSSFYVDSCRGPYSYNISTNHGYRYLTWRLYLRQKGPPICWIHCIPVVSIISGASHQYYSVNVFFEISVFKDCNSYISQRPHSYYLELSKLSRLFVHITSQAVVAVKLKISIGEAQRCLFRPSVYLISYLYLL